MHSSFVYLSARNFFALLVLATLCAQFSNPISATCGLHVCPIPVAGGANQQALAAGTRLPSQVWLETRYASFDIGGKGSYLQTSMSGVYEHRLFRTGAVVPVIYLDAPTGSATGLGNATLFGEFYLISSGNTRLSFGSQLETPTGNHDKGLAANHFMAVPYANLWQLAGNWRFALQLGYQQTLGGHEHSAVNTPVLYVNPHSDSELISRAMASYTWSGRFSAELNTALRQVTAHDAVGDKTFFDVGLAGRLAIGENLALRLGADFPVISAARYLWQAYAGFFAYF